MLRTGRLKNGSQFWQNVEDKRISFNIACILTILINSCTFEQSKDTEEVQSILHCKTTYCYQKVLPSVLITSEKEKELRSKVNHGLISGGVSLRTVRQAVFFTIVIPIDNQDDEE